jgi:AcrR family transcriptional regulator
MKTYRPWDDGTQKRLLEAAGEVFAQRGFRAATIREICRRANTSVSAVNYHFGDKKGLYAAVFEYSHRRAIEKYPHHLGLESGSKPEDRLRAFIHSFLLRGLGDGFPSWHGKLIVKEMADPSGVLRKVAESTIRPMYKYLELIVRELLKKNTRSRKVKDEWVQLCSMNIVGQCVFQHHAKQFPLFREPKLLESAQITAIADQITRFSIGGIQAIAAGGLS